MALAAHLSFMPRQLSSQPWRCRKDMTRIFGWLPKNFFRRAPVSTILRLLWQAVYRRYTKREVLRPVSTSEATSTHLYTILGLTSLRLGWKAMPSWMVG